MNMSCKVSVVIPVYNEVGSLRKLTDRLLPVLESLGTHEVIFVNDGSTDGSTELLDEIHKQHQTVIKVIHLRTNFGKAIALQTGFNEACGQFVAMMDADLQDQPEDIPKLIKALENGLDAVTGWKVNRRDPWQKTIPSFGFNLFVRWFTGLQIHDFNCGLKAFRRECLESLNLYGQMHRFIIVFICRYGFKVGEVPTRHEPRRHGKSKYGLIRIYHGWFDILTVFFITRYLHSPLYFFGFYAILAIGLGLGSGLFFLTMHILARLSVVNPHWRFGSNSLWLSSPVLLFIGLMVVFFGLIGELLTHYFATSVNYRLFIRKQLGPDSEE